MINLLLVCSEDSDHPAARGHESTAGQHGHATMQGVERPVGALPDRLVPQRTVSVSCNFTDSCLCASST